MNSNYGITITNSRVLGDTIKYIIRCNNRSCELDITFDKAYNSVSESFVLLDYNEKEDNYYTTELMYKAAMSLVKPRMVDDYLKLVEEREVRRDTLTELKETNKGKTLRSRIEDFAASSVLFLTALIVAGLVLSVIAFLLWLPLSVAYWELLPFYTGDSTGAFIGRFTLAVIPTGYILLLLYVNLKDLLRAS